MVDQRFKQVEEYLKRKIRWQALPVKNTTNRIYVSNDELILRLNAPANRSFGVDRQLEDQVLMSIQPFSWAPTVILNKPESGWCLMEFHGGNLSGSEWQGCYEDQLFDLMQDMHAIRNVPEFNYQQLFKSYESLLRGTPNYHKFEAMIDAFNDVPKMQAVLTHHDIHKGNLCLIHRCIVLIDWEYAGSGNPLFDLAYLFDQRLLSLDKISQLPLIKSSYLPCIKDALTVASEFNSYLEELWYLVRS